MVFDGDDQDPHEFRWVWAMLIKTPKNSIDFELPAGWASSGLFSITVLIKILLISSPRLAGPAPGNFLWRFYIKILLI